MDIDARHMKDRELFARLKEVFGSREDVEISIDVLVPSRALASRIRAFSAMTGCNTVVEERGDHLVVHITGGCCRCG